MHWNVNSNPYLFVFSTAILSVIELFLTNHVFKTEEASSSYVHYYHELVLVRILGIMGVALMYNDWPLQKMNRSMKCKIGSVCSFLVFVSNFLALFVQLKNYIFLNSLRACVGDTLRDPSGDTAYFFDAYLCEVEILNTHSCSCVSSSKVCYSYTDVSEETCGNLINSIPTEALMGVICTLVCTLTSLVMVVSATLVDVLQGSFRAAKKEIAKTAAIRFGALTAIFGLGLIWYFKKTPVWFASTSVLSHSIGDLKSDENLSNLIRSNLSFVESTTPTSEIISLSTSLFFCIGLLVSLYLVANILKAIDPILVQRPKSSQNLRNLSSPPGPGPISKNSDISPNRVRKHVNSEVYQDTIDLVRIGMNAKPLTDSPSPTKQPIGSSMWDVGLCSTMETIAMVTNGHSVPSISVQAQCSSPMSHRIKSMNSFSNKENQHHNPLFMQQASSMPNFTKLGDPPNRQGQNNPNEASSTSAPPQSWFRSL